uniref:Bifunctional inhibitor/plant lipid transfer protein/seed storage helical domain-containing protein n=1 Tax=Kalanchoe fedtschenkoi TaxID=63787 RepID=A0A7N0ZVB3_KALFE
MDLRVAIIALSAAFVSVTMVHGQAASPACTPAMLTGFSPCVNYINNINRNVTRAPPTACCTTVKTLAASGSDCWCQLVTGRSPFQFQINPTQALSLTRACNMPTISPQCDAASEPIPAPAPGAFAPLVSPAPSDESDTPSVVTPSPSPASSTQATGAGSSPPSSAAPRSPPTHLTLIGIGTILLEFLHQIL